MSTTSPPLWKSALAEVIGTLTLIFIGAGAILSDVLTNGKVGKQSLFTDCFSLLQAT